MDWQPIETAPNGVDVWAFGLATICEGLGPIQWQGHVFFNNIEKRYIAFSFDDGGRPLRVNATHWAPLPEPPK